LALFLAALDPAFSFPPFPPAALASSSGGGWSVIRATSFFSVPVSFTIWNIHFFYDKYYFFYLLFTNCWDLIKKKEKKEAMFRRMGFYSS
jgi:hypothetical protein